MKKIIQTTFLLSVIAFPFNANANVDEKTNDSFFITKGSQFQLCRELKEVLNSEENKDYPVPYISYSEFNIPKRFKNFHLPRWQDIPTEDLSKYMKDPDGIWKMLDRRSDDVNLGGYKLQKTRIDFDLDGEKENIIRFVYQDEDGQDFKSNVSDTRNYRFSYVSDIDGDTSLNKKFNGSKEYPNGSTYFVFFYKGKAFKGINGSANIQIYEPKVLRTRKEFWVEFVCESRLIPEKEKKAKNKFQRDGDLRSLKKIKEIQKTNPTKEREEIIEKLKKRLESYEEK
jgi:hypothetical protein